MGPIRTTYVTGFIDIKTLEPENNRRTLDQYKRYCTDLLSLDIDLIYFGDAELGHMVAAQRAGKSCGTVIIPMTYTDLYYHKYYDQIMRITDAHGIFGQKHAGKFTPLYITTILSKLPLLQEAARLNPFSATHFCWIDFGYFHLKEGYPHSFYNIDASLFSDIDRLWSRVGEKYRIQAISEMGQYLLNMSKEERMSVDRNMIAGGMMGGTPAAIDWVASEQERMFSNMLAKNIVTSEEMVLLDIFLENPDRFDVNGGYYSTILQNFATVRMSSERVIPMINAFISMGMRAHAANIAWKLLAGHHMQKHCLNTDEIHQVCMMYLDTVDDDRRPYVRKMCILYGVIEDDGCENTWKYHHECDSLYGDIRKVDRGPMCLADLIEEAEKIDDCVAFTSRGWLKHTVSLPLRESGGYEPGQGIYLRSSTLSASGLPLP